SYLAQQVLFGYLIHEQARATLERDFDRLDVDAPGAAASLHRALRFAEDHPIAFAEVPHRVENADARVIDRGHEVARVVFRLPDGDDDFMAHLEHRANRGDDGEVDFDGVANESEAQKHARTGTEGCA